MSVDGEQPAEKASDHHEIALGATRAAEIPIGNGDGDTAEDALQKALGRVRRARQENRPR